MDKQKLQEELKQSMLAKNELKTSVLRLLLSAINYYEIQKGGAGYEANQEDVLSVIQSQAKQRRDSIEEYKKANRLDLSDKEQKELEILQTYLPQQLTEEELKKLVDEAISKTGASTIADMGKVMGALMPKVKGKADGSMISNLVKHALS
ncbi:MAG: GatB/YqeY domain-containing protein [Candidatus Levybacteria bacterium]|nr:GatB/YqeY domain-containing protein [Candidatus Levybacteria bacterium]